MASLSTRGCSDLEPKVLDEEAVPAVSTGGRGSRLTMRLAWWGRRLRRFGPLLSSPLLTSLFSSPLLSSPLLSSPQGGCGKRRGWAARLAVRRTGE